jgi:hypothetical protein
MANKKIPAVVQEAIKESKTQYETAESRGKIIDRFSKKYETSYDYLIAESKSGRFNPQSSTGRRILRDIRQGHALFDMNSMRGHGSVWVVENAVVTEKGTLATTSLKNRRQASKVAEYDSALAKYRKTASETEQKKIMKPFEGKSWIDAEGRRHKFVTDHETLYQLDKAGLLPRGDEINLSPRSGKKK